MGDSVSARARIRDPGEYLGTMGGPCIINMQASITLKHIFQLHGTQCNLWCEIGPFHGELRGGRSLGRLRHTKLR